MFEVEVRRCGDVVVFDTRGELNETGIDDLRRRLQQERENGQGKVLLNGSGLRRVRGAGLPGLARAFRSFRLVGGKVVLAEAPPAVRDSFDRAGILRWVNAFTTEVEALRFLGANSECASNKSESSGTKGENDAEGNAPETR